MGLIHYLACWKHMAAVDLDKSSVGSKREISYNKYEPNWRSFVSNIRSYVLKDLQNFMDEHEDCRLYLSYDSGPKYYKWRDKGDYDDIMWIVF